MTVGLVLFYSSHGTAASWIYTDPQSLGLPSSSITALHQDQIGQVWVGTEQGGMVMFDGSGWNTYELVNGHSRPPIISITSDLRGIVWAIGKDGNGLWRYSHGVWNQWMGSITTGIADKRAKKLVGAIACYALESEADYVSIVPEIYERIPFIISEHIDEIVVDLDDNLWILYKSNLVLTFDGEQLTCWEKEEGLPTQSSVEGLALEIATKGQIWISLREGPANSISVYENGTWELQSDVPPASYLAAGLSGVMWAGGEKHVSKYVNGGWEQVFELDSSEGSVMGLTADGLGGVWIVSGASNPRLIYLNGGEITEYPYPNEQAHQPILLVDRDNRLWLGDPEGLYMLEDGSTTISQKTWGEIKTESQP